MAWAGRAGCGAWCWRPTWPVYWRCTRRSAGVARLSEVLRIPLIDYAAVFLLAGIIGGAIGLVRLLGRTARWVNEPSTD